MESLGARAVDLEHFEFRPARVNGTIELGKYKLDLDEVRFSDARPGPGPATGNIGYDVLRYFVVTSIRRIGASSSVSKLHSTHSGPTIKG
jgi:hypothetical protein